MAENRAFKIQGIKTLLKRNYEVPEDVFDLESIVDDELSMAENWAEIKDKVILMCQKDVKYMWY